MKLSISFWLAFVALTLEISVIAHRLITGDYGDWSNLSAAALLSVLMLGILGREWAARGHRRNG